MKLNWKLLKAMGRKVYKCEDWKDYKRYYVFLLRCALHRKIIARHIEFFEATSARQQVLTSCPWLIDQATRQVFYQGSSVVERAALIEQHYTYCEQLFKQELLDIIYVKGHRIPLWQGEFEEKPLVVYLDFRDGQQKEGCLSLELVWDSLDTEHTDWAYGTHVYQIMFSFIQGEQPVGQANAKGELTVFVGALQGLANGSEMIKRLTKAHFGYRPKNLIMWCLRSLCEALGVQSIVAVSNAGYYAMNHFRLDRKLKVDLNAFWQECEGRECADKRFYLLPVAEHRKDMSELKPSKRAQHRRRFELLDAISESITASLGKYKN